VPLTTAALMQVPPHMRLEFAGNLRVQFFHAVQITLIHKRASNYSKFAGFLNQRAPVTTTVIGDTIKWTFSSIKPLACYLKYKNIFVQFLLYSSL
jgi:hypothetical protein